MALDKITGIDWLNKLQANEVLVDAAVTANGQGLMSVASDAENITGTSDIVAATPGTMMAALAALAYPITATKSISSSQTVSTAALSTVYPVYGHLTASHAAIASGTVYAVRGEMTLSGVISAGGAYLAGVSAKLVVTGTQNHADSRLACIFGKFDATGGTLTAGETSLLWLDMVGVTGIPFAEFNAVRLTANADAKFTSLMYAQADASFVFDWVIPTNGHNAFVTTAGTGATSAGNAAGVATKVFLIRSSGTTYYVPMFLANT